MSDHCKFDVHVVINDQWELGYAQKERGDKIKEECVNAVKDVLEKNGFRAYRDEFWVTPL